MLKTFSLNREFSFFEVEKQVARKVHNFLNNAKLDGRTVQVHKAIQKNAAHYPKFITIKFDIWVNIF